MTRESKRTFGRSWGALTLIVVLTALVTLLGAGTALAADHWTDMTDQKWVSDYGVTAAQAATVAAGYPDGTFRPGLAVHRGQFAKMVVAGLGLGTANPLAATFSDVSTTDYYFPWVEGAHLAGVISGYLDGTFRPGTAVSRQQADSILGRYLSQQELSITGHIQGELTTYATMSAWYTAEGAEQLDAFVDAGSLAPVDAPYAAYLAYHDVVKGSSRSGGVYLDPGSSLTRAQAVALILRVEGVTFIAPPTATQSTVVAVPTSVPADGTTTSTITVTLKDLKSNPVAGKTVTLAKTSGPGTPTIGAASGVSSASGMVTFTVKSTTAGADVFTATDTTDAVVIAQTATVTFTGSVTSAQSTVTAQPASVPADNSSTSTITVTLRDGLSNPVAGKTVNLAKTSGPGTPTISAASGVSSASGVVTFTVKSTTAGANIFMATDATDSVTIAQAATVTFTAGTATHYLINSSSYNPIAGAGVTITAQLADANGNPVSASGNVVTWTKSDMHGSFATSTSTTNASGMATVGFTTSTVAGTATTVTGTSPGPLTGTSATITTIVGPATQIALNLGNGQTATAGMPVAIWPSVIVEDVNHNPVSGVSVTFAVTSGGGLGTALFATTNSSGIATIGSWTLGTTAGANTLTATSPGLTGSPVTFSATGIAGVATHYLITSSSYSPVAGADVTITAQLVDANDNPVATSGNVVTWTKSDAGGSFAGATTNTDPSGIAAVVFTTNTAAGTATTVTGTTGSVTGASATITTVVGEAAQIAVLSGNNQVGVVDTVLSMPPRVIVTDANGNPVSGVVVTFTIAPGGGVLANGFSSISVMTDINGIATAGMWTLGSNAGPTTMTATIAGPLSVIFDAMVQMGV